MKRKREVGEADSSSIPRPAPGTVVYTTGKAAKTGLASASRQAFVAFTQQILTPHSKLPLAINSPAVIILQQYLDVSPVCDEVFDAWNEGDKRRDEKLVEAAVYLLAQIIRILTPLPFFRGSVVGIVNKLIAPQERYHDLLNRLVSSNSRDGMLAGLSLAAAATNVEKPDPTSSTANASSGRLATKVWGVLLDGGSVRGLGKQLGMRRRRKDGSAVYDEADPMDKPDIRHLVLDIILPLVSTPQFHSHAKSLLRPLYSNLEQDPPITILRILTALWEAITGPSAGTGRKTALVLLDESALGHLVELFSREQVEPSSGRTVAEMVQAFVEGVTTKPGRGICFADEGWYPRRPKEGVLARLGMDDEDDRERHLSMEEKMRRGLHNRILSNVVRKLGGKVVDDNGRVGEWAVKLFEACPELVAGYWPNSALAVDPRLNARWIATMAYIGSVVSLPCPDLSTFRQPLPRGSTLDLPPYRQQPPAVLTMIESILPSPLTKVHMTKGLSHADHLVQLVTAQTLARCLQKLAATQALLRTIEAEIMRQPGSSDENPWSMCVRELELEARRRVPELMVVIAFAQKSAILGQVAEDEEADEAMASKSAMLTEAALRLFGLYHEAIPAITRDTKFDVGRLLVSSSSVKQERRERKDAKANAGSVADETMSQGSVGSMGSAGTAGMGGGFGYAKGDVKGFEALSQVHVLHLLGSVKGWQWINKASGSQYTYLYHILQLHLASHHPSTILHTTALIRHLLLPTPLFDHDPSELDLWLSCLPRLPTGSGALGIIQQVHFLSFFDDCVRRCVKLPYRYLDEVTSLIPGYFNPQRLHTFPSILLMTMIEQWCAKVGGSHMSSEAAGVVGHVIGRLLLGLAGKMRDLSFVRKVRDRMQGTLDKLRADGKAKEGLEGLLKGFGAMLSKVDGAEADAAQADVPGLLAELLDEREWRESSFEYNASQLAEIVDTAADKLTGLMATASPGAKARQARFAAHMLASRPDDARQRLLALIKLGLESCSDATESERAREAVLDAPWIKEALTSTSGDALRADIDALVTVLDNTRDSDCAVAEQYVLALEQGVLSDKKGKRIVGTLDLTMPWARFFTPSRAAAVIAKLAQHGDRLHGTRKGKAIELSPRIVSTIETLIGQCTDAATVLADLSLWADVGVLEAVADVVRDSASTAYPSSSAVEITPPAMGKLLDNSSPSTGRLIEALVLAYPSAAGAFASIISTRSEVVAARTDLLPAVQALLELPDALDIANIASALAQSSETALNTAVSVASAAFVKAAVDILARLVKRSAVSQVSFKVFTEGHARLAKVLADSGEQNVVRSLLEEGLKTAIGFCADTKPLTQEQLDLLAAILSAVQTLSLEQVRLDGGLVEAAISAITQDRLSVDEPVLLAAALVQRCEIKLSLLSSTSYYNTLCAPSCLPSTRLPFIRLYAALFHSSTYTSCQPNFIEPLLPLYTGSLHIADRLVLGMWQTFESVRHLSVASVLRNWSPSGLGGVSGAGKALDALTSLDGGRLMATCANFPLRRTLGVQDQDEPLPPTPYGQTKQPKLEKHVEEGPWGEREEKGYDPVFVLSLLGGVLAASEVPPGKEDAAAADAYGEQQDEGQEVEHQLSGLDWVEILRSDTLGVAVCALASRDAEMRRLAGHVLSRVMAQIQEVTFHERDQLLYVLTLLRHATPNPSTAADTSTASAAAPGGSNGPIGFTRSWDAPAPSAQTIPASPRLPTMTTLFIAYHLHSLGSPSHFLYPLTSRFLLQRPVLDLYDPPMLYALLYGSDRGPRGELPSMQEVRRGRGWVVRLIRDGTRSEVDWSICRRRNVWALLSSMFRVSVDVNFRRLILQTMENMALVPQAARTLTHKYCIFPWAKMQFELSKKEPNRASAEERERYVRLVELCVRGCVDGEMRKAATLAKDATTADGGTANVDVEGSAEDESSSDSDSDDSDSESESESDADTDEERIIDPLTQVDEESRDPLMAPGEPAEDAAVPAKDTSDKQGDEDEGAKLMAMLIAAVKPRPDWLCDIEAFIDAVIADADLSRLAALSRILLRIAVLPQAKETIAYCLPVVVERLVAISPAAPHTSSTVPPAPATEREVVENLFRAGLAMGAGEPPVQKLGMDIVRTRAAVQEIGERARRMQGEVGEWIRREMRIVAWESMPRGSE